MPPTWVLLAGGSLLMSAVAFAGGWQVRTWKAESDELKVVKEGIERGKEQQQLSDYKAGRYEDQRYDAQAAGAGRSTEVRTIYRTQQVVVPAGCEPPADALRVLDSGIAAAAAQAAGQPQPPVPATTAAPDTVH